MSERQTTAVDIRPWTAEDLPLELRLMGDPAMTEYLGGPEPPEKSHARHERFLRLNADGTGGMFVIVVGPDRVAAGSVGYWETEWGDQAVWEAGWSVLPEFQGQGLATLGILAMVEQARADGKRRFLHAFPAVDNGPSNAVCRKAGFTLLAEVDFEYPPGHPLRCNDWVVDLAPDGAVAR